MAGCWKCGRNLGPMLEHQKMVTESGPICYACYNAIQEKAYQTGQAERAREETQDEEE